MQLRPGRPIRLGGFSQPSGALCMSNPQEMEWQPTQFKGISIKVLYEDKVKGEMTMLSEVGTGRYPPDAQTSRDRANPCH
jgi:hypothetical protein